MTIDWITVAAQLINFLVLVWLLKRFLYRPILDGIDARESEIAERMSEAACIRTRAESTVADYEKQKLALQQEQAGMRDEVRQQATAERDSLLSETHERIRDEQAAAKQQQKRQAEEYVLQLHQIAAKAMLGVISKALHELSDETFEERLVLHALANLEPSPPQDVAARTSAANQPADITLTTQARLDEPARQRIQASVKDFWPGCKLHFTEDEHQSPGALVQFGSSQVTWTVDAYVNELATTLTKTLESVNPGKKTAPDANQDEAVVTRTADSIHADQETT